MTNPLSKNKIKIRVGFYEFSDKSHRNWTLIITRGEKKKKRSWSSVDNNNLLYYYRVQSSFSIRWFGTGRTRSILAPRFLELLLAFKISDPFFLPDRCRIDSAQNRVVTNRFRRCALISSREKRVLNGKKKTRSRR
jgi:hypothetical protein